MAEAASWVLGFLGLGSLGFRELGNQQKGLGIFGSVGILGSLRRLGFRVWGLGEALNPKAYMGLWGGGGGGGSVEQPESQALGA